MPCVAGTCYKYCVYFIVCDIILLYSVKLWLIEEIELSVSILRLSKLSTCCHNCSAHNLEDCNQTHIRVMYTFGISPGCMGNSDKTK